MKHSLFIISLLLLFVFSGCDKILEESLDCLVNKRPELSNNQLKTGRNDTFYSDRVWAQIKNEPRDDNYYYDFSLRGELPRGLEVYFEDREVFIEGTPRVKGTFSITISVRVDARYYDEDGYLEDPLCRSSDSRRYELIIR